MASINPPVLTYQGGIIGGELHNRVDIPSYPSGAEVMENFRPRLQGTMTRRPPMLLTDTFSDHTKRAYGYDFVYSDVSYLVKHSEDGFEFYADDGLITIPSVTASLSASWSDYSLAPATATVVGSNLILDSNGTNRAIAGKTITTSNVGVLHVVTFEIVHGPVNIRIGTTLGGEELMSWMRLRAGHHYLAFTPTAATTYLQFWHDENAGRYVKDTVAILPGTQFLLPTPFLDADIGDIWDHQIRAVIYLTHPDYWPRRLERRGDHSWSIVKLLPDDGPFGDINTTAITLQGSDSVGEITLTASDNLFTADDVGTLFAITGAGQSKSATATAAETYTGGIKVTGAAGTTSSGGFFGTATRTGERSFVIDIVITGTVSVSLQRSSGNESSYATWTAAPSSTAGKYSTTTSLSINDALDNQVWYYRLGVKTGDYTSGSAVMTISFPGGSSTGVVRVVGFTDDQTVTAEVITGKDLPTVSAVKTWKKGDWNASDGFPRCVTGGYGRLWFGRGAKVWASKSDDFTAFDESDPDNADSAFSRTLAVASDDAIRWMAMLNYLVVGTLSVELIGLGNTTSDAVGPGNFQFLPGSEEGGAAIVPVTASGSVLYVHRSRRKLMQFVQNPKALSETSFISVDLTARAPEILDARIAGIALQSEPERRIFVWLESGRLVELLFRREGELDVVAWSEVITDGRIEDCVVLPRADQDTVNFFVKRKNNSGTYERFIERYGPERLVCVDQYGHLDGALQYELEKPATVATPSGTTGTITVTTDDDAFVVGDVGSRIWLNWGRGTISDYTSAREVEVTVTTDLKTDRPADGGTWGFNQNITTFSGMTHMANQSARVWADFKDLGAITVNGSGEITLPEAASIVMAGRPMRSRWKSLKLAYGAQKGSALTMPKAVKALGLLLYRCGASFRFGPTFERMWTVKTRDGEGWDEPTQLFTGEKELAFDAGFRPDARLCYEVDGPAPATVSGHVPRIDERDR